MSLGHRQGREHRDHERQHRHAGRGRPPHRPPWPSGESPPAWRLRRWQRRERQGRLLFLRFVGVFGAILLLAIGGMGLLAWLITQWFGGSGQVATLVWLGGCSLALALPLLAGLLAARAARGITTPLADVMAAADAVAAGDLTVRVPDEGNRDFRGLAHSFNRMTGSLQEADQQRRDMMADVAHELRTPLHIIQGNLEGILDGVYEPTPAHIDATLEETRSAGSPGRGLAHALTGRGRASSDALAARGCGRSAGGCGDKF